MTPAELSLAVVRAVRGAVDAGVLRVDVPRDVKVERTRPGGAGEYASGVALKLAAAAGLAPRAVAEDLRGRLAGTPGLARVDISGPGFLNFTLDAAPARDELVRRVLAQGREYGYGRALAGQHFDFAPVTEPRALVVTSVVVELLRSQGATAAIGPHSGERLHVLPDPYGVESEAESDMGLDPEPDPDLKSERDPVPPAATPAPGTSAPDAPGTPAPGAPSTPAPGTPSTPAPTAPLPALTGPSAARWAYLRAAAHDRPARADELLSQRDGNPYFRVRYAYSRTRALTRNARDLGFSGEPGDLGDGAGHPLQRVSHAPLLALLADHPGVLLGAARLRAPDRVARQLEAVADAVLDTQHGVLPVGDEKPSAAHRARLALAEAAGAVLAGGLSLFGIDAPEFL
ncbi:ArgS-related anticodon-binding protein NrtL [Streptomyces sp. NPDC059070]|uniref:ArgS-related anticodon-binding protein NrtL n=1 Tax=Streptomyces sp. NPDC059070 TaxID=3346713 RepID=UPI003674D08C